jgi:hypothetical protein
LAQVLRPVRPLPRLPPAWPCGVTSPAHVSACLCAVGAARPAQPGPAGHTGCQSRAPQATGAGSPKGGRGAIHTGANGGGGVHVQRVCRLTDRQSIRGQCGRHYCGWRM